MYELKKNMESYLPVNLLGPGPRLLERKEFTVPRSDRGSETLSQTGCTNSDPDVGLGKLQYATRFH